MCSKPKQYSRDDRSPTPLNETVSRYMRKNKSKDTKPELLFRKQLWSDNIRGYRLHWKKAAGKPDIAFPSKRIAVFINGCFWHRCPKCNLKLPKNNAEFWKNKFDRNVERDKEKIAVLEKESWKVLVIWECELKKDKNLQVQRVKEMLK